MVCKEDAQGPFIYHALFMVLGHEFLRNNKRYHVSMNITSSFLASLLNLGGSQADILMLMHNIFKEIFLEDDVIILVLVEKLPRLGIGIPFVDIENKYWEQGIGSIL